ncbi:MAG: hypothetical protein C5B58_06555 [Acidobacteria bacterium]|nr:MAG: hypothetical protein C5B58_06555 [Acidobacteriota bacterium]
MENAAMAEEVGKTNSAGEKVASSKAQVQLPRLFSETSPSARASKGFLYGGGTTFQMAHCGGPTFEAN